MREILFRGQTRKYGEKVRMGDGQYQLPRLDFDLEVIGNIHDNPELLEVE